ncbi:MAG: lipoyl synthase [Candidatus Omnitrophota bacterium]
MIKTALRKNRLPEWFRQGIPDARILAKFRALKKQEINTVCFEARCPNWSRCLSQNTLTFMILGNRCTRSCRFCAVEKPDKILPPPDKEEANRILNAIRDLQLKFVIITSVTREDLDDGGAGQFVSIIKAIRNHKKDIKIEVLIPDFSGEALSSIVQSGPDVLAHNLETVPRLYPKIRIGASYSRSLQVLAESKKINTHLITKSSLLLGMSEEEEEVRKVMDDLSRAGCDILVLCQYLSPTPGHYPVKEYITKEQFLKYEETGLAMGFKAVLASPLARTSYQAQEIYNSVQRLAYSV